DPRIPRGGPFHCAYDVLRRELVGAFSQKLRHLRKVDPYKAKGIIYDGERIRRKAGKTVASGAK
ncbi:MAG: hypothetical protein ACPLZB_04555, partial [Caldisericaceae bacterium]